jgi:hypothetical protein
MALRFEADRSLVELIVELLLRGSMDSLDLHCGAKLLSCELEDSLAPYRHVNLQVHQVCRYVTALESDPAAVATLRVWWCGAARLFHVNLSTAGVA